MNDVPWALGWEAVGAIFGVLSFLIVLILEREKLSQVNWAYAFGRFLRYLYFFGFGSLTGWLISGSIFFRILSILLTLGIGWQIGEAVGTRNATEEDGPSNGLLISHMAVWVLGLALAIFLWGY